MLVLLALSWATLGRPSVATGVAAARTSREGPLALEAEAPGLERCEDLARRADVPPDAFDCYVKAARKQALHEAAVRRLRRITRASPPPPGALLSLAVLEHDLGRTAAEGSYRAAIAAAEQKGDTRTAVLARAGLAVLLGDRGRQEEARVELRHASRVAEASSDRLLQARVWVQGATLANRAAEYGTARNFLARAEEVVSQGGPPDLRAEVLSGLGFVGWAEGRLSEAVTFYRRQLEILLDEGDLYKAASARYNIALVCSSGRLVDRAEVRRLESEALAAAIQSGNRSVAAKTHLSIGEGEPIGSRQAREHYQRGLELAVASETRLFAMRLLGGAAYASGRQAEGLRWFRRALEEARSHGTRFDYARAWSALAAIATRYETPQSELMQRYLRAFEAVETIRDLQPAGLLRSRVFGRWTFLYYRFAGRLLERLEQSPDRERDLELAFHTGERLRARALLDRFDGAGVSTTTGPTRPVARERERVLGEISRLQMVLMSLELPLSRRRALLAELERLERLENGLRDRLARADSRFGTLQKPLIPTLNRVRQLLGSDEALISFQVWYDEEESGGWETGGSWAYLITRDTVDVFRVPRKEVLDPQVAVFTGMFQRRDGSEVRAAAALHGELLDPAIRSLPSSVRRLTIVPDGVLYGLPFAALRASPGGPPLAARFELAYSPSVTLWTRWRERSGAPTMGEVLALADPALDGSALTATLRATDPWREGLQAGRLRSAPREARALVRALGGGRVWSGSDASEAAFKRADFGRFGTIVFATHAVVDDERPDRSAVLLARGGATEDGLLQFREIVDLDFRDRFVLLSACRSAAGEEVSGEGPMGLAHAFFQAGARAVIASLWMVRDDEQAQLAGGLADALASGRSLSAGLAAAQKRLIARGAPAAAWAGLVILGDGSWVPRPSAASPTRASHFWPTLPLAAVLCYALLRRRRRRRDGV